ncbi:helix-turn-helix transcriptional regulator, partial [Streptomyces sp. UMAF16]|nr:helix-turn-helix transcriptional regulator [Streptomyces sp. UMAF16]
EGEIMTMPSAVEASFPAWEDCTPADDGTPAIALRALRRRDGVSRTALARACGIEAAQITAMEDGTAPISPEVATILARVFRTVPAVFF